MTDLQVMYLNARAKGARHHAALRDVASRTGLDKGTVDRCLRRARQQDERDARARKRANKEASKC